MPACLRFRWDPRLELIGRDVVLGVKRGPKGEQRHAQRPWDERLVGWGASAREVRVASGRSGAGQRRSRPQDKDGDREQGEG